MSTQTDAPTRAEPTATDEGLWRGLNGAPDTTAPGRAASSTRRASSTSASQPTAMGSTWTVTGLVGLGIAIACSLFVFVQLRPDLLFANTTPSGGDMGAHVWGPAFLRDHLLPAGRLSGWTPDWYAGFPAFHFYMVIPALAIVALNAGLPILAAVPLALLVVGGAVWFGMRQGRLALYVIPALVVAILLIPVPYGISFKLISVSGLVAFPLAAWVMGRLARAPEPVPAFLSIASLFFLFDTNFTIYGGNIASTLAGEFAFSISLSLTLVAIGLVIRGMDEGRGRLLAAVVIGLIALTHIIPVFFAVTGFAALMVLGRTTPRMWPLATGIALALIPIALADNTSLRITVLAIGAAVITFGAVVVAEPEVRTRTWWLALTGPIAALLSAFWLLPFYLREPFFNDMGWERLNEVGPAMLTVPMKVALPVAAVGLALSLAQRERIGLLFATTGAVFAAAVANLGEGPLWNARLLPFFYLSVYLLAAVGAALVIRFAAVAVSESFDRPDQRITVAASLAMAVAGLIAVSLPLRILPFGIDRDDGTYDWFAFTSHAKSFVPSWTAWNYSGYERKASYREYRDVVMTMDGVGQSNGCGRAMWEYSADLDRYGTPMALMLLPHWTDGCIGSMEGLYFESSSTTPFHFLNQSVLSQDPSRAQRDLPYLSYDIDRGVEQLQVMGVRYYMALTDESIAAAREHPDLLEVASAPPFVVFDVAGSGLVEPLAFEPLVVTGRTEAQGSGEESRFDLGWLGQAVSFYNDPGSYRSIPAEDGPAGWERAVSLLPVDGEPVAPTEVSEVRAGTSSISFSVDQVGTPVLVKASYFPNWKASGADGPWRAGPNLMVVVPTETEVRLDYGRTAVDWLGVLATVVGLLGLVLLARLDRSTRASVAVARSGAAAAERSQPDPDQWTGVVDDQEDRDVSDWLTAVDYEPTSVPVGGSRVGGVAVTGRDPDQGADRPVASAQLAANGGIPPSLLNGGGRIAAGAEELDGFGAGERQPAEETKPADEIGDVGADGDSGQDQGGHGRAEGDGDVDPDDADEDHRDGAQSDGDAATAKSASHDPDPSPAANPGPDPRPDEGRGGGERDDADDEPAGEFNARLSTEIGPKSPTKP